MSNRTSCRLVEILTAVRSRFGTQEHIPLHAPIFKGNEINYLSECVASTFVSTAGPFVDRFESMVRDLTSSKYAVSVVNGTAALHISLIAAGVKAGDEVVTQPISFASTCNSIAYINAYPAFVDVDDSNIGMSPDALKCFFHKNTTKRGASIFNKSTGRRIAAVLPMHVFGLPLRTKEIAEICGERAIPLIEDAAEALGSWDGNKHAGTFGLAGIFSFNGNKVVTCGGGGCIVTESENIYNRVKHLSTTAKTPHKWEYFHDEVGYNYRMPNLNAALGCAQLEMLEDFITYKRETNAYYRQCMEKIGVNLLIERAGTRSNYWLNAIVMKDRTERDAFLQMAHDHNIMARPVWTPLHRLPAFSSAFKDPLPIAERLADQIVNLPSSASEL